jgi:hypothetical protein
LGTYSFMKQLYVESYHENQNFFAFA